MAMPQVTELPRDRVKTYLALPDFEPELMDRLSAALEPMSADDLTKLHKLATAISGAIYHAASKAMDRDWGMS